MGNSTRREFLTWGAAAAAAWGLSSSVQAEEIGPEPAPRRRDRAFKIRVDAARRQARLPLMAHPDNGDERRYADRIGSFSKGLPHNDKGEVDRAAYRALIDGLDRGDLSRVPLGGSIPLANPRASYAFHLEGPDSHALAIPPAPAFAGAVEAFEMGELYWRALTRDVLFQEFDTNPWITAAVTDLSYFTAAGRITRESLFRGPTSGDRIGPFISQFLYLDVPFGPATFTQRIRTAVPGDDHLTTFDSWLANQNGRFPSTEPTFDPVPRFIRNGRDLALYVQRDFAYQAPLNACLILLGLGPDAIDAGNPYLRNAKESGFVTFGAPHVLDLIARAANAALKAVWFQKWLVHRRLRPDAFAARIHVGLKGRAKYPIHEDIVRSASLDLVQRRTGTYLLPQAYPDGSPVHPSYPAGHAAIVGAGVTILKAFFRSDFVLPRPVVPNSDGTELVPFVGPALTIGGELDKLASNISLGRDTGGVHWRSDGIQGMALGEAVALGLLRDEAELFSEKYSFTLTKFDGETVTIGN